MQDRLEWIQQLLSRVRKEVRKVIIGQQDAIDQAMIAILTGRHALVEGVPGVAKTMLVRSLAHLLGCEFQRIQFTSDLTPTDVIGTKTFNPKTNEFTLIKGPIFTTFLLADEINRAHAKTQSALLEAMQEHQVTIDRHTYPLSPNFTVFATQNPIEFEGTYPLAEAQKDRFLIKIFMGCPDEDEERQLGSRTITKEAPQAMLESGAIKPVLTDERLAVARQALDLVEVSPEIVQYAVAIVRLTRNHSTIQIGAGPRATESLLHSSRVHSVLEGRSSVIAEDVQRMTMACIEHRITLKPEFIEEGLTCAETVEHILQSVPPPMIS